MNVTDEQTLRQRLREEIGALEISPAPVLRVTGRGQGVRIRRRVVAVAAVIAAAAVAVAAAHFDSAPATGPTVTVNAPNPAPPHGVFASGTIDGKPWALAVRNIAADPGTRWCLPAVMVNGRDGDVLFGTGRRAPPFGNPALLRDAAGLPGIGFMFAQVAPDVTRLSAGLSDGIQLTVRPVRVSACGQSFDLAGFAFAKARHRVMELDTYTTLGLDAGLPLTNSAGAGNVFGTTPPGVWANTDGSPADIAASRDARPIGTGTVNGATWRIKTALGLFGQCYTVTARARGIAGHAQECMPIAAPPSAISLSWMPFPYGIGGLTGYAGLVNPRTAEVAVDLSNGTIPPAKPVIVAGRVYAAFAVPPGCQVLRLKLFDSAGHMFASTTRVPPAG